MLKALVVDDEKNGRELLRHMLNKYCKNVEVCGSAKDVISAVELINLEKPDVVFLDIEMPGGSGFDVLEKTNYKDFSVIFVTGYDHYAIRAIKYAAKDYLLKPIDLEELKEATRRALEFKQNWQMGTLPSPNAMNKKDANNEIIIHGKFKKQVLNPGDIIYLESAGNYTLIHLIDTVPVMASKNLTHFERIMYKMNFYRLHRKYMVNLSKVKEVRTGRKVSVEMENGMELPLAVRRKGGFLRKLNELEH
ncbi:MAG TPA: LytTR family DNA-binding domain-containing protein [Saprospiraceae bacterium]|nr:LytTR family DNA-binding domain-containing protein [Saprospiraceae bacterium]